MSAPYGGSVQLVVRAALEQGWRHDRTQNGHHRFYAPDGQGIVVTSGTPSDSRGFLNFIAEMRRHGFKTPEETEQAPAAPQPEHESPQKLPRGAIATLVRDALRCASPHPRSLEHVTMTVRARYPAANELSIKSSYYNCTDLPGFVKTIEGIAYRPDAPAAPTNRATDKAQPIGGEEASDVAALEEALTALARIEAVVRKYQAIAKQTSELRKALGTFTTA